MIDILNLIATANYLFWGSGEKVEGGVTIWLSTDTIVNKEPALMEFSIQSKNKL